MPLPARSLSARVLARLISAEAEEPDPWLRDDLKIARLTVASAARGEAVLCSPHVLASYAVLGLHPEKVWPAIQARRNALGPLSEAPPKKPAQSVKLWFEKTNDARAVNSCAANSNDLRDQTISVPMAAPSINALYPNPDAPSSGKRGEYSYEELLVVIADSGAPAHVRQLTLDALEVRGRWPKSQGPVTPIIAVSIKKLQDKAGLWRSTVQRRIQRARRDGYWRKVRDMNSWLNCPKCGAARDSRQCPKCPHKGNGFDAREFRRTFTDVIDVQKFENTPPCRQVREIRELRARHSPKGIAEISVQQAPVKQPAAEHAHRDTTRPRTVVNTQITDRAQAAATLLVDQCGLPDDGVRPYIISAVVAEARFAGLSIDDAAKSISECVRRDQRAGIAITRFYFRDAKWRTNGGQRQSAGAERAERSKRNILEGLARYRESQGADARSPDAPDGPEREE